MWQRWVRRGLLGLVLLLSSSLVYTLFSRTEIGSSPTPEPDSRLTEGDAGIEQFTFFQSQGGEVQWEVRAQRAQVFEAEHQAMLDAVRVTLYGERGRELTLEGERGTIDTVSRNFVLANEADPITIDLDGGYTVYTNHLAWTEATRELRTNEPVTIVGHGMIVNGQGFVGNLDSEELHVPRDVRVQITP